MRMRMTSNKKLSFWSAWLMGVGICVLMIVVASAAMGILLINETVSLAMSGTITKALLFCVVLLGVFITINLTDAPIAPVGAAISGTLILIQLLICAFSSDGLKGSAFINSFIIFAATAVSAVFKLKKRPKSNIRKKRYR